MNCDYDYYQKNNDNQAIYLGDKNPTLGDIVIQDIDGVMYFTMYLKAGNSDDSRIDLYIKRFFYDPIVKEFLQEPEQHYWKREEEIKNL